MGLSYKQIGKKLGIDSHKEEVIQVYKSLGIDIETVHAQAKVAPPTALWYLFDSEREVIKSEILPSPMHVKELLPQNRIVSRLGDNAGYMLHMYQKVNAIIGEEIASTFEGASATSSLGSMKKWNGGDVGIGLIRRVFDIQKSVAEAAFQLSDYNLKEVGNCMCAAIKSFRFGWKEVPIPHPSFFWGCSRYTPMDSGRHDKATPAHISLWKLIDDDVKMSRMSDKDLRSLQQKNLHAISFWERRLKEAEEETGDELFKHAFSLYGGPKTITAFDSIKGVLSVLKSVDKDLIYVIDQRNEARDSESDAVNSSENN